MFSVLKSIEMNLFYFIEKTRLLVFPPKIMETGKIKKNSEMSMLFHTNLLMSSNSYK